MLKEINLPDKIDQVSVYECVFDCDFSKNGLQWLVRFCTQAIKSITTKVSKMRIVTDQQEDEEDDEDEDEDEEKDPGLCSKKFKTKDFPIRMLMGVFKCFKM